VSAARDGDDLPFTGERFTPGAKGEIWIEHWHRYHFAARWGAGKNVVDVACGEGYGSALLARTAAHVTGVDISPDAIQHAKRVYGELGNVEFACASCTQLPLADASVDMAVSFETIEHIAEQAAFLNELARVLKPDGVLVISCPNKLEYSDKRSFVNEFHVKELYRDELSALLAARFPEMIWYGQRPSFFSVIAPEGGSIAGELFETSEAVPDRAARALTSPLYFVVAASRIRSRLEAIPPVLSVLSDSDEWVHHDYEKVMGELQIAVPRGRQLEEQVAQRERSIASLQEEVRAAQRERALLEETLGKRDADLASMEASLVVCELHINEKVREIDRRRGWRWWLKLPFIRLGLLK
jgi:SAM-dependent methyltransferase